MEDPSYVGVTLQCNGREYPLQSNEYCVNDVFSEFLRNTLMKIKN
jgi:hypothetical protein